MLFRSHASTRVSVSQSEWDAAHNAIVNNTRLPIGASAGTLSAYHSILEKNRVRLQKEQAELDKRRAAADESSQRRANLSAHGSIGSRSLNSRNKHRPRIPRLSERDVAGITQNLSSSFMTMDSAGLMRPKTAEGATVQLVVYLVSNPPAPDDPRAALHRVALESLNIIGNTLTPAAPAAAAAPAPPAARADNYGGGSRRWTPPRDARDDITQRKVDKGRRQRAARVGFEGDDSDESQDGEIRGAECFHYRIREAMPPKRFKPAPTDADKYDGQK